MRRSWQSADVVLTNRDRIIEVLRLSSLPLDDDQIAQRARIQPRQTVNQTCRRLQASGVLRRFTGPDRKIVNELVTDVSTASAAAEPLGAEARNQDRRPAQATIDLAPGRSSPPGSSQEQRDAERVMLDQLAADLAVTLEPAVLTVPSGARVEVDGADAGRTVLVECWAHQGRPKSAQRHKVLADALKLAWIATTINPRPRLILCMSDPLAVAPFLPTSGAWAAQAFQDFGIEILVVDLPADVRQRVDEAQARQYR